MSTCRAGVSDAYLSSLIYVVTLLVATSLRPAAAQSREEMAKIASPKKVKVVHKAPDKPHVRIIYRDRPSQPYEKSSDSYILQPQLSTLGWDAKAVTNDHYGTLQFSSGELLVSDNQLVGGSVTVDMKTIVVTDITDAETNSKFIGHITSDDFFGTAKYATANFKITKIIPINPTESNANNAAITGDLFIKGITKQLTFPAKVGVKNGVSAISGTAIINRTQYGITYGSKSFFEGLKDRAIQDEFTLSFNVIARK